MTVEGAVWRWDGYTMRAGAPSTAAVRLSQRNRLAEIREQIDGVVAEQTEAQRKVDDKKRWLDAARESEKLCVEQARQHERQVAEASRRKTQEAGEATRSAERAAQQAIARPSARPPRRATGTPRSPAAPTSCARGSAGTETAMAEIVGDVADAEMRRTFRQARLSSISDTQADRARRRTRCAPASPSCARRWSRPRRPAIVWRAKSEMRVERLGRIAQDHASWSRRLERRRSARSASSTRGASRSSRPSPSSRPSRPRSRPSSSRWARRSPRPRRSARKRPTRSPSARRSLAEADKAMRSVEAELAGARESRVRREGLIEQATKDREAVVERIVERLRCEPDGVLALAEVQSLEELPEIEKAEHKLERLVHERETMGAVNLRAEEEANELEQQITGMTAERDDLVAAIGRLRQGIQSLNREGRERFLVAFEQVSGHFQQLFTKLFGGGKAELRLTESEDPLEAGLEIHASPPGKKLQVMSLLSGGEQALTALSLLFAVFMTNPAPICVLDEVDAPLDDLNVERFCGLVKEIAGRTDTRFLIITHHRVTMARMDRLYGVTMAEQGVTQLVSVNLQEADRIGPRSA